MKTITSTIKDRALMYYHIEWILSHPRFGFLMLGLVALSFTHEPILAAILFAVFTIEIGARIAIMMFKTRTNPYRTSLNRKIDGMFLVLDIIGVASLLITIFDMPFQAEDAAMVRVLRAVYLLRTLRMFRYFDLQSAMYSPTYGMFTSLVILVSFFATDTLMWVIIIFFAVELYLRYLIMNSMNFESNNERLMEWGFWWLDALATIVMIPAFAVIPYGGALRMMRLIRLLRPWVVIIRNLRDVMREGQFLQEINLIVLVLAVISIGGGIFGHFMLPDFDFTQDGQVDARDQNILARIWFSFRLFTDPGNAVTFPDSAPIAILSILAVVIGVFIFAFFIGIGASIVSGLMTKLRNERLAVTRHMVMFGWTSTAPYILESLRIASERSFTKLKLVMLHHEAKIPEALLAEKWVTYRHGDSKKVEDLKRVNLKAARQALVLLPEEFTTSESLSESFFSLLAIRSMHPDVYLSVAVPGMNYSRIPEHKHMLQVGWDNTGKYNKPTVIMSQADFRANAIKNILGYCDFDQVLNRLMIPERAEESAIQVIEWSGKLEKRDGSYFLYTEDGKHSADIYDAAKTLLSRGAILLGVVDDDWDTHPIYHLNKVGNLTLNGIAGIALNENALHGELNYVLRQPGAHVETPSLPIALPCVKTRDSNAALDILITGWTGSLPLLLKRLAAHYQHITVTLLDNLSPAELISEREYIERRLSEDDNAHRNIKVEVKAWDFSNMEMLRPYIKTATHILLSKSNQSTQEAYAIISTLISHVVSIAKTEGVSPVVMPMLKEREQARLLQEELDQFDIPLEIHLTVPEEFYGAYVAHTSFHMYTSENDGVYQTKRALRHIIHDLMSDVTSQEEFELQIMPVTEALPEDPELLFEALLKQGYVWIGYRLNHPFVWTDPLQSIIQGVFPRKSDFSCLRQRQIIINPFGNPISRRSWVNNRDDIVELIVIGENNTSHAEKSAA